jgi:hypothetical protein
MTIMTEYAHTYSGIKAKADARGDLAGVLRDCCLTTIDHALIRGLATARPCSVVDLPPST